MNTNINENFRKNKIRIRLQAYDYNLLKMSCNSIIKTTNITEAKIIGPISLPTKRKIYCVLRSPHVDKDSREHFEILVHTRLIDIYKPSAKTIDALMKLNIPAGVDIEVKL
uniref:Small ribosomal subunit protein uS10c n=1 Tax=Bostrychia simpliciuscula TaxID=324754 RepID=A0A1Z1M7S8_9FLOR|nr:ribosomal protein S10 [Bostrychia simpliciuscula]ARW62148.1 ribosomal protein S10 [Bostrychia simpliciuscula]